MSINSSPKKSNAVLGISIVIIIIVSIVALYTIEKNSNTVESTRNVTYQVESTGGFALVVYTDRPNHKTESKIISAPFNKTISLPIGTQVYLTASNPSQIGEVSCSILLDHQLWKQNKSKHPTDSVACGGIVQ